jgi:hypothetical protein
VTALYFARLAFLAALILLAGAAVWLATKERV